MHAAPEPMRSSEPARYTEASRPPEPMRSSEVASFADAPRALGPQYAAEPMRHVEPPRSGPAISAVPPVAPTGPLMDDLPPSAARPLSFLRNGGGASAAVPMTAPASSAAPAYVAELPPPTGPVLDDLPPSAARPLSFLRNKGAPPPVPVVPPMAPAGATPLSRTTEPAPTVRVTNVRRPEPSPGPAEPPLYSDEDARYYPEENSPEGCASGECLPDATPDEAAPLSVATSGPAVAAPTSAGASPTPTFAASAVATAGATFATSSVAASAVPTSGPTIAASAATTSAVAPARTAIEAPSGAASAGPTSAGAGAASSFAAPPSATPGSTSAPRAPFTPPPAATLPPDPEPEAEPIAASRPAGVRDNPNRPLIERWRAAVESVKAASPRHGAALANGRLVSMRAGEIVLGFLPSAGFHRTAVTSPGGKATVDKALAEHFGRPVKLTVQEVSAEDTRMGLSIAEQDAQSRAAHEKSTEGKVRTHPAVRAVLKYLGGEIEHIQVYEPERPSAVPTADTPDESA